MSNPWAALMPGSGYGMESVALPRWGLPHFALLAFYTVGFSGLTSFPLYTCKHTGLFLVAFYVLALLVCVPVCYVQIKLGSVHRRGILHIFTKLVPILKGVAVALLVMTFIRCLTHGLELSYAIFYLFASFQQPFPWSPDTNVSDKGMLHYNEEDLYFVTEVIQRSAAPGHVTPPVWYIALGLLAVWSLLYVMLVRGAAVFAKVVMVLAPTMAVCAVVVMGYAYAVVPDSSSALARLFQGYYDLQYGVFDPEFFTDSLVEIHLGDPELWLDALDLHLHSVGLWAGVLPSLGSHLFPNKVIINASWVILLTLYCLLPHLLLLALAPLLKVQFFQGWLALATGIKPGLSLLFVTIPHTFAKLGLSPVIAVLLYTAVFLAGLLHLAVHVLCVWENLLPCLPRRLVLLCRRHSVMLAVFCLAGFLLSLPYSPQCGVYLYMIVRYYLDRLLFAAIIFSMVPFVTGYLRLEALRLPVERVAMGVWYGLASLIASCLLIYQFAVYLYPKSVLGPEASWAEALGWLIAIFPMMLCVTAGAAHALYHSKGGNLKERLFHSLRVETEAEAEAEAGEGSSDDYESGDTGETGETTEQIKPPLPPDHPILDRPNFSREDVTSSHSIDDVTELTEQVEKAQVEVSIKPPDDNEEVAHV